MPSTAVSPPQRALLLLPPLLSWLLPWLLLSLALAGCAGTPVLPEQQTAATAVHSAGAPPGPEQPGPEQPRPEQPESKPAGGAPLLLAQAEGGSVSDIEPTVVAGGRPNVVGQDEYNDPWIGYNRAMFRFNDWAYRNALIPLARGWRKLPDPVEDSVGRFFANLRTPITLANHLLQGEWKQAGTDLARFTINSTLGLLGFADPAQKHFGLEPAVAGFDDTLLRYGVDHGPYLVLPLLGPSSARQAPAMLVDMLLNPVPYLVEQPEASALLAIDALQQFAPRIEPYPTLRDKAEDPYLFFRNMHLQGLNRDAAYGPDE